MAHKLTNFTRGSQLIGHFGFMFAAGVKTPLLLTAATFSGFIWWRLSVLLDDHETYLCWMRVYAWVFDWFGFDPAKKINLQLASGAHILTPIATLPNHPLILAAWDRLIAGIEQGGTIAALITVPCIAGFGWIATRFGRRAKESLHERGAVLATKSQLVAEIRARNAVERAREYGQVLGRGWRFTTQKERRAAGLFEPYKIAGVPFPWRLEQSHAMLIGTTGAGKTVALRDLLSQARERGDRAVIFDLTGAFIEAFYDPTRDVILNPTDARCPQWSIFDDCPDEATLTSAAEALVPLDNGGSDNFWVLAARTLFIEMCLKLRERGLATNAALGTELMTASLAHIHEFVVGTVAGPLTSPDAPKMAQSIHSILTTNGKALMALPTSGPKFAIRDWIGGSGKPGSFLFVSSRYAEMAVTSHLLTLWMDTAMMALMSGERSRKLQVWFLFDELGALHRMPALEKGLQTARNYGGAIVAGVHAYAKLKDTYGENMATTIASLTRTKLVLAAGDRDSAIWCSDAIGHTQVRVMEEGYSYGADNARDAVSLTPRTYNVPLVLPDTLKDLPSLRGYLKFPDGFPAAAIKLRYVEYPRVAEPYIKRDIGEGRRQPAPPSEPSPAPGPAPAQPGDDQGRGPGNSKSPPPTSPPPVDPIGTFLHTPTPATRPGVQGNLPLAAEPAGGSVNGPKGLSKSTGATPNMSVNLPATTGTLATAVPAAQQHSDARKEATPNRERDHGAVSERNIGVGPTKHRHTHEPDHER